MARRLKERITLYFENDELARTSGTVRPDEAGSAATSRPKQVTVVVPPEERVEPGIFEQALALDDISQVRERKATSAQKTIAPALISCTAPFFITLPSAARCFLTSFGSAINGR